MPLAQQAGTPTAPSYQTISYTADGLRLEAYLYLPPGDGRAPLIVYNHGSREGQERVEQPMAFIGRMLTRAGYAVLVPERRGYGRSGGMTFREEIGRDTGNRFVTRLRAETSDAVAAIESVAAEPRVDSARIGIMGWSLGGIISVFASSRSQRFFAVVDQAGGALSWQRNPALQAALRDAARDVRAPILCMDAENDATTAAVTRVCDSARAGGAAAELRIYPAFSPNQNPNNVAPGHLLFSGQGASIWAGDVVAFFDKYRPH